MPRRRILDHVGDCPQPRFIALAALLLCLPGARAAESTFSRPVYEVGIPVAGTPSKIGLTVSYNALQAVESLANWEVTVSFNAAECKIFCGFRQKRDPLGRTPIASFLTPPVAIIRVYTDSESKPTIFVVDPGGLTVPALANCLPDGYDPVSLPGRKLFAVSPVPQSQSQPLVASSALPTIQGSGAVVVPANALPLRI